MTSGCAPQISEQHLKQDVMMILAIVICTIAAAGCAPRISQKHSKQGTTMICADARNSTWKTHWSLPIQLGLWLGVPTKHKHSLHQQQQQQWRILLVCFV